MNKEKISKAISMIDDDLLEEADIPQFHKSHYFKYMTIAACFIIAVTITFSYLGVSNYYDNEAAPNATSTDPQSTGNSLRGENTFNSQTPYCGNAYENGELYRYGNDILTVLQRESESILLEYTGSTFNYDILLNVTSPDGETYVFSTDITQNTLLTPFSVEVNFLYTESDSSLQNKLVKISYEELIKNGYTVDEYVTIENFGKIFLKGDF